MSHPSTEETLLDEGKRPLALWFGAWFGFCLVLLFGLGLLVFFSPHHGVFPSPSMMTWALVEKKGTHSTRARAKKCWNATCQDQGDLCRTCTHASTCAKMKKSTKMDKCHAGKGHSFTCFHPG